IKTGKVVIILSGRYAGKKAIVVQTFDGNKKRNFGHCLVAGIARAPLKVTKSMSKKKILRRSRSKVFVKYINYTHIMPTRYTVGDIDLKSIVVPEKVDKPGTGREKVVKAVGGAFFKK